MSTAADYGLETPAGDDLVSEGDDVISANMEQIAALFDAFRYVRPTPAPMSLNDYKVPGATSLGAPFPTGWSDVPEDCYTASTLLNIFPEAMNYGAQVLFQYGPNPRAWWRTMRAINQNSWNPWTEIGVGGGGPSDVPVNALATGNREMRLQLFRDAYPLVSTGGKGAVVFRYDHGLTNFKDVLKPIHDQYGISAYIAMNSRTWEDAENSGATQAEARTWTNVEWGNHTADHQDKTGIADIWDNIVNGRIELEDQLGVTVHGFTMPGVTGLEKFDGLGTGNAAGYSNTYAGALIMSHHAIASGVIGAAHRPLDGEIRIGGRHYTWERSTWTEIKAQIDQAVADKTALTLMCHPRTMGSTSGGDTYWNAALAEQVISYVRARIDAGELADLSYYQSHHATTAAMSERDTGSLTVTSSFAEVTNGQIYLRRVGNMVHVTLYDVEFGDSTPPDFFYLADRLPVGYRPASLTSFPALAGNDSVRRVRFQPDGRVLFYTITASTRINLTASYLTPDSWPS